MHDGKDIYAHADVRNGITMKVIALVTNPQTGGSSYFLN